MVMTIGLGMVSRAAPSERGAQDTSRVKNHAPHRDAAIAKDDRSPAGIDPQLLDDSSIPEENEENVHDDAPSGFAFAFAIAENRPVELAPDRPRLDCFPLSGSSRFLALQRIRR